MKNTHTKVVNGKTHTVEETRDGSGWIEVEEKDEAGRTVAWYRRKAAPDAAAPLVPSEHRTIKLGGRHG